MTRQPVGDFGAELQALQNRIDEFRSNTAEEATWERLLLELESAHEELRVADEEVRAQQQELEDLVRAQRTERWMHQRLVSVLPVAVLVTDSQGVIRLANSSAGTLLHIRVDRLLGKPIFAFLETGSRGELRRRLVSSVAGLKDFRSVTCVRPRHGEPVTVDLAGTVRRDIDTGAVEVTWVLLAGQVQQPAGREGTLPAAIVELTRLPLSTTEKSRVLPEMAQACQRAYPDPVGASITIGDPSEPDLVATGSKIAQSVDGAQVVAGQGPCREAWDSGASVQSPDLHADTRWPRLAERLGTDPVRSAVAVPLVVGDQLAGALGLYSEDEALADASALREAELLGAAVAAVLDEVDARSTLETTAEQLKTALRSRATIDQAKGIVMAVRGCGPDEAFEILSHISSTSNIKLRDLAARMVERASQGIESLPRQRMSR